MGAEVEYRRAGGSLEGTHATIHYASQLYPAEALGDPELWPVIRERLGADWEEDNEKSLIGQWQACIDFDVTERLPDVHRAAARVRLRGGRAGAAPVRPQGRRPRAGRGAPQLPGPRPLSLYGHRQDTVNAEIRQDRGARLMQIRTEFPRPTRTIPNTFIPLADGTQLAARIWLPEDAEADPVPAILEYIPYRKDDGTAARDALMHPWWAGHGYANVRVDQRGSGDSDGIMLDEYLKQEHDDALEVIAWLAEQPWCTGKVGIMGKSWGGFNGLQIAARRPPALAAVLSVASTDDRYATDVHYIGGALHGFQMQSWASTMLAYNARPPDPLHVGERWRELWLERLEETPPYLHAWVSHQRRDAFWKHGSVCEDYSDIQVPVYMVGGWQDGYTDAIFRFMEGYGGVSKGLCGPWGHVYPQSGLPKPAIGFLQDSLRFWDRTLKDIDNGMLTEPPVHAWIQEWVEPADAPHVERPGRWVTETAWPPVDRPEPHDAAPTRRRRPGRGRRAGRRAPVRRAPARRPRRRRMDGMGLRGRRSARPARRGRALALLHVGAAARARRDARVPRGAAHAGLGQAAGARGRARLRRRAVGRLAARQPRLPEPHAPRLARASRAARARPPLRGGVPAQRARATHSRPGTGSASRSLRPTGRSCGPPPSPSR